MRTVLALEAGDIVELEVLGVVRPPPGPGLDDGHPPGSRDWFEPFAGAQERPIQG